MVAFAGTAGIASCAEGVALDGADAQGSNQPASDAGTDEGTGPTGSDGSVTMPDAPPMATGSKLILTEVVLAPSTSEFIEIANPTGAAVNLSNYYLSDSGAYFRTPTGTVTMQALARSVPERVVTVTPGPSQRTVSTGSFNRISSPAADRATRLP